MKIKKSDFVRICNRNDMKRGEWGVIIGQPDGKRESYSGRLIMFPDHDENKLQFDIGPFKFSSSASKGAAAWGPGMDNCLIGILPNPPTIEVEDD